LKIKENQNVTNDGYFKFYIAEVDGYGGENHKQNILNLNDTTN
jgi:hypothetical protein